MTMIDKQTREERRREQHEGVGALEASGALDGLYAIIDSGRVRLEGKDGLIQQLIKAGLERGLQAELTEHLGYEKGDPEAGLHPNSRNGTSAKTVATSVEDVELAIPRDRDGSFTPVLVPKGSRRVRGLDDMIVSLYAGGMPSATSSTTSRPRSERRSAGRRSRRSPTRSSTRCWPGKPGRWNRSTP